MWRRSNLPGNPDSDQSISEEEEELADVSLGENDVWPKEKAKEEGGLLLQTKLEKLIGCGEVDYAVETGNASPEATLPKISSSLDDDVEVPDSLEESYSASDRKAELTCVSAHESLSDDEILHDEPVATWSAISKETESLIHLNGVSSSHSTGFRTKRVVKDHMRPKFSFHSHTHGETSSKICDMAQHFEPASDMAIEEDPIAECPHDSDEISENRQGITDMAIEVRNGCTEEPVPKLLDIPTDKIRVTKRSSKPYCRRKGRSWKFAHKGNSSIVQDSSATDDELPGPMDSGSSTDDEASYQSSVPNISNLKKQFVGDRFDEAIKASSLSKEGLLFGSPKLSGGSSLYGKLQQIMKQEKETEMEITKKLQGGIEQTGGSSYVDVRILSRYLEAKLVVCKCSVIDLSGDSLLFKNTDSLAAKETKTRIIFNPKVCGDVDIEVGCFIRLYAPWKEMEVKNTNEVKAKCSSSLLYCKTRAYNLVYMHIIGFSTSHTNRISMDYLDMVFKKIRIWKVTGEAGVKKLGYRVHGHPFSTNTRRVLAILLEKGLSYEPITVDLQACEHKREPFLSLNPFGQVPVLEDGNVKLCESRAITQYIAYVHSSRGTQLLNLQSHETMATLTMWMEIEAHQFDPPASKLTWELVIKPLYGLVTDQTVVKENEAILEKVLNIYEKRLGQSKFLACNSFTLVDLHHLPNIQYLLGTRIERLFKNRPNVRKWVNEITSREAWKMACDQDKSWFGKQMKETKAK